MLTPAAIKTRSLLTVGLLSALTLGLFNIYLVWCWATELNAYAGDRRHSPRVTLVVSLVTLGLGAGLFECLFAWWLERDLVAAGHRPSFAGFSTTVIALNVAAVALSLTLFGAFVGLPSGIAATVLLQRELNRAALLPAANQGPRT